MVRSEKVPAASSSWTALARAFMFSVLSTAPLHREATSAIESPTPVAASEIRTWASAAEYWALMTSFLLRNCSILVRRFCSEGGQLLLLLLEFLDLIIHRLQLGLDHVLALERGACEILTASGKRLARLRVELHDLVLIRLPPGPVGASWP